MPLLAFGQGAYPSRPIKMIVPFAAGGGTDILARLLGTHMAKTLRQPIVVDNRGGAGGSLGSDLVAKASPDGYTILMATVSTHAINPALYAKLPYDPIDSFSPISLVAKVGGVAVVNARSPITSLRELAEAMRARPGQMSFGSQGVGGIGHLMGEMFNTQAQTRSIHVPYKGAAPALQDLLAGNIDVIYDTLPALLPHLRSGALRALAVTTAQRAASIPDVPTTAEAGFPGFQAATWNALLATAGVPRDTLNQLQDAARQAVQDPEVRARMQDLSVEPVGSTGSELQAFMRSEIPRWAAAVKASGARAE
ncbi:MAG: ABC transporter substrate-binding protein [Variovorax paradoxus]|nr:MAG: ABC transporter substrate-binding protein [Variovorax paradoxus]PZQ01126.1 MAG: ABC transporter substrate-binding protein [Variovorax paradoxus]